MNKTLLTVIMPVYNGEKYIQDAIDSVMQQNQVSLELIIINDGSTDNTTEVITHYQQNVTNTFKIYYYQQEHKGLSATFNHGLSYANGNYLAFIDADDIWHSNKLAKQLSALTARPQLDMIFCHCQQFYSPELSQQQRETIFCPKDPMPGITSVGMLVKHASLQQVGGYNIQWRKGPFIDWFARAQDLGLQFSILPDVLYQRRLHSSNMGVTNREHYIDYVRILKASLDRRRVEE